MQKLKSRLESRRDGVSILEHSESRKITLTSDGYEESQTGGRHALAALTCRPPRPLAGVVLASALRRQLVDVQEHPPLRTNHLEYPVVCSGMIALSAASRAKQLVHQLYCLQECPDCHSACCHLNRVQRGHGWLDQQTVDFHLVRRTMMAFSWEVVAEEAEGGIGKDTPCPPGEASGLESYRHRVDDSLDILGKLGGSGHLMLSLVVTRFGSDYCDQINTIPAIRCSSFRHTYHICEGSHYEILNDGNFRRSFPAALVEDRAEEAIQQALSQPLHLALRIGSLVLVRRIRLLATESELSFEKEVRDPHGILA